MVELNTLGGTIKPTYEGETDTNAFTDAEKTKLAGLMNYVLTAAEIAALPDSNVFTDLDKQRIDEVFARAGFSGSFSDLTNVPAFILASARAAANGVASLDATGKVPMAQLNVSGLQFKGAWDPVTNTPQLINGTGNVGDFYKADRPGSASTGLAEMTFSTGDWIIFAGGTWQRLGSADTVSMVNGKLGNVVLTAADVGALPNTYTPPAAPVQSVNGKVGTVALTAADVGAKASSYVPSWNEVTSKPDFPALYQPIRRGAIGPGVPAVFAQLAATYSVTASTERKIPFTSLRYDIFGTHDGEGGFTVPSWAKYARGNFHLQWATNNSGERQARMSVNGASAQGANMVRVPAANILMTISQTTAIIPVTAGQVLSVTAWQNSGSAVNIQSSGSTWFNIEFFE